MQLQRRIRKLREWLDYTMAPDSAVSYVGWTGHNNLGDEVLLEAAQECFAPLQVRADPMINQSTMKSIAASKRFRVAMLGGGTLIGNHPPLKRFRSALDRAELGLVFGAGVSEFVLEGPVPGWLEEWGRILRNVGYVGVRGKYSAATLARVGVQAHILGDPVCWFSQPVEAWKPLDGIIGINVGQAQGQLFGQEAAVNSTMIDYIRELRKRDWKIEFYCVWPEDLETTKMIANGAGIDKPIIRCFYRDARAYIKATTHLKLFLGMKLHAVALAMCANVPSIMIEYRSKCREFMESMNMERFLRRTDRLECDDLVDLTEKLQAEGDNVSVVIRNSMLPTQKLLSDIRNLTCV